MFNITFHGIGPPGRALKDEEREVWLDTDVFLRMLDRIRGQSDFCPTFDDGNRSDVEVALPALLQRQIRGQFFIIAGWIGAPGCITVQDLRSMQAAGMVIGCHGMHHRPWRRMDPHVLQEELYQARNMIEQIIGSSVTTAAFPFGAYDRRSLAAVRAAGFGRAYTCDGGAAAANDWLQTRNTMCRWDTPESLVGLKNHDRKLRSSWRSLKRVVKSMR